MKVYRSPAGEVEIPRLDLLTLLFDSNAGVAREDTKVHVDAANPSNSITKGDARRLVRQIAYLLRNRYGIGAREAGKDVVFTVTSGSPFAPVFFYSVVAAGGIYTGASPESHVRELSTQALSAGTSLFVCSPECKVRVLEAAKQSRISTDRVLILDCDTPGRWTLRSALDESDLLQGFTDNQTLNWTRVSQQSVLEDVTVCLLYSSGTTGLPKGVRISHWSLVSSTVCSMHAAKQYMRTHRDFAFDTVAHLPMSNVAGIGLYSVCPFYMGGTTYWMKKYNFDAFIETHRRFQPAYQFSVPPIWLQIAKSDKVTDHFDGLLVASTGSAPIGYDTIKQIRHKLGRGKADIYQTWGTTETSGVITAQPWEAYVKHGAWSVGELCPNVTMRILDELDQDVGENEPGELLIGGPILAQGYHNRPDVDKEAFGSPPGFYRTGDIGIHKDGLVYIVDRKKELIKYKANQVAPAELEALLTSHPMIIDAAVIGVWDDQRQTEVPRAYVVRKRASLAAETVQTFVKDNVVAYKQLRGGVVFLEEIPKSASGKILRKELRQKASKEGLEAKL